MQEIQVNIVERGVLADVLRGKGRSNKMIVIRNNQLPVKLEPDQVAVGYMEGHGSSLPCILIVREGEPRELFAWANTYCPFVTPLSQWCRVLDEEEFKRIGAVERIPEYGGAITAWAGAVIGEALLRTGVQEGITNISVAVLQSCSSFIAARAFGLWGSAGVRQASVHYEEVRQLLDPTVGRQDLSEYIAVWSVLEALSDVSPEKKSKASLSQTNLIVMECCKNIQNNGFIERKNLANTINILGWSGNFDKYEQSTAEQRLEIYDSAVMNLKASNQTSEGRASIVAEFIVAYFASKISGRTSGHIKLIRGLFSSQPMMALWYGIVSALHHPETWGMEFNGLARLATRELGFPVRLDEAPRFDVSLAELMTLVEPADTYSILGFRGASPKTLSVELSLGVTGITRLSGGNEEYQKMSTLRMNEETRQRIQRVAENLRTIAKTAMHTHEELEILKKREIANDLVETQNKSQRKPKSGRNISNTIESDSTGQNRQGKIPLDESC